MGGVEVPYQHFKDFEYYWNLHSSDEGPPWFIVTGAFANDNLVYSTISVIEESGDNWRTIWSIQHDLGSSITVRIRGLGAEE